jgi:hypothetical protein
MEQERVASVILHDVDGHAIPLKSQREANARKMRAAFQQTFLKGCATFY